MNKETDWRIGSSQAFVDRDNPLLGVVRFLVQEWNGEDGNKVLQNKYVELRICFDPTTGTWEVVEKTEKDGRF